MIPPRHTLVALLIFAASNCEMQAALPTPPPKLSAKDFTVLPFCNTLSTQKLDPKQKKIFNELKVTTSDRIHIFGKKVYEAGWVGTALHFHLGKVVLAPPGDRTGTLSVKQPSGSDSISYYLVLDLGDKLKTKWVTLKKGPTYIWTLKTAAGVKKFTVLEEGKEVCVLSAPEATVAGFGFAATARWPGNEVDLAAEFD